MNYKEGIKFINECQDENVDLQEKGYNEKIIKVIQLLQRGEKFEAIVKEIDERLNASTMTEYDPDKVDITGLSTLDFVKLIIKDIKQKYFPEVYKRKFTIELETNDIHAIQNAVDRVKIMFDGGKFMNCTPRIKEEWRKVWSEPKPSKDFTAKVMKKIKEEEKKDD